MAGDRYDLWMAAEVHHYHAPFMFCSGSSELLLRYNPPAFVRDELAAGAEPRGDSELGAARPPKKQRRMSHTAEKSAEAGKMQAAPDTGGAVAEASQWLSAEGETSRAEELSQLVEELLFGEVSEN